MKWKRFNRIVLALAIAVGATFGSNGANSEEDTLKRIQQAKYNFFTGNWDVHLKADIKTIADSIKTNMPNIDYTLVDEEYEGPNLLTLTFRGDGDQKVVIKLKRYEAFTNLRIRVGLTGNESKSAQIFNYLYRKM